MRNFILMSLVLLFTLSSCDNLPTINWPDYMCLGENEIAYEFYSQPSNEILMYINEGIEELDDVFEGIEYQLFFSPTTPPTTLIKVVNEDDDTISALEFVANEEIGRGYIYDHYNNNGNKVNLECYRDTNLD